MEKIKAENLHGADLSDRELIFKTLLPQEKFVDRRITVFEDIEPESEDPESEEEPSIESKKGDHSKHLSGNSSERAALARTYVGELIQRVEFGDNSANFIL